MKIKDFLNEFGIWVHDNNTAPYSYSVSEYTSNDAEKIKAHLEFLKSISAEENVRLNLIESKTAQLVSQTGIIFSLLSLFIPIFIDKVSGFALGFRLAFIIVLVLAFLFYMLTIRNAIKNFNIKQFVYSKPSPTNVLKYQNNSPSEFSAVEVKDLLHGANQNLKINNTKATNLIHSYNAFKAANSFTALLGVLICCSLLFAKPKKDSITIEKPIKIENFDSAINNITTVLKSQASKTCVRIDTTNHCHHK